jgi:MFS family permease
MANFAILIPLQEVAHRRYNLDDVHVGLCYLPFAAGAVIAALIVGKLLNWNYARVARSIGVSLDCKKDNDPRHFPIERARLDLMWPWIVLNVAIVIAWGWVVSSGVSLPAPLVMLFLAGFTLTGPNSIVATYLVDLYPMNPGRVSSTFNLTRATMNAVGVAVVQQLIEVWGYSYTYLFLGLLVAAMSPGVWVVRTRGHIWREQRHRCVERARVNIE